ncbi:MAG: MBOAT family O-acyltransferase [Mucispirillum sp.]|nr:MBOAT family O-acyltransferase [Mucispirillum sp.]
MWSSPQYLLVMIGVIIINYFVGIYIDKYDIIGGGQSKKLKSRVLIIGIVVNVLVLFIFKYLSFTINSLSEAAQMLGFNGWTFTNIVLPVGISFYIFQSISYLVDIYRKDAPVQKSIKNLALYISMFPQLVAGPIVRYNSIAQDIERKREISFDVFILGLKIFIIGLAKKVLIANQMAVIADTMFAQDAAYLTALNAWIGALAYTFQIYFDFSGYSDMAIGLGLMIGFKFPINFNYPYISYSITDFWRRWHISLSSWFKDYIYIPLGGNRVKVSRMYLNLLIVFTITGIWHGANWTFLVWGLFHGFFLVLEKFTGLNKMEKYKPFRWIITMVIVITAWVFFRADTIHDALLYIKAMFGFNSNGEMLILSELYLNNPAFYILMIVGIIGSTPLIKKYFIKNIDAFNPVNVSEKVLYLQNIIIIVFFAAVYIMLANNTYNPFIYFRF